MESLGRTDEDRRILIKEVWPDKLLYAVVLLTVSAALGLIHGLVVLVTDIAFSQRLSPWLEGYPVWLTVLFSLGALVVGLAAWRRLSVRLGVLAGVLGVFSLGLFGIGSLHALIALVFLVLARLEREDQVPPERRVDRWDWPDKALAASLLLLMAGTITLGWGAGVFAQQINFGGDHHQAWGAAQFLVGLLAIYAAIRLYHQRAPVLGLVACVATVFTFGGYIIAPGLAVAALVALGLAWREDEFRSDASEVLRGTQAGRFRPESARAEDDDHG